MQTHWVFNHCEKHKQQARAYWEKKTHRLKRLLSNYNSDLRRIRLTLYRHSVRDEWELRGVLQLPTGTLIAEETCATLQEVIDKVADELSRRICRHKSQVRKDHLYRRRRRRREQLAAASPFLADDASAERSDAFVAILLPYMDQIFHHAQRELAVLERDGELPKGAWTPRDVVDDVLLRACETYNDRPQDSSLDVWLFELFNQRLEELCQDIKPLALVTSSEPDPETYAEADNADLDDIQYWMAHVLEPAESASLEELLPDEDLGDIWERMSLEEQHQQLTQLLTGMPKHQRQALILRDAYGFEMKEIARALNRSEQTVEADIQSASETLRRELRDLLA